MIADEIRNLTEAAERCTKHVNYWAEYDNYSWISLSDPRGILDHTRHDDDAYVFEDGSLLYTDKNTEVYSECTSVELDIYIAGSLEDLLDMGVSSETIRRLRERGL